MLLGSTHPIFARIVSDMNEATTHKAACLSRAHAISGFSAFLIPPVGAMIADTIDLRAPFAAMASVSATLLVIITLNRTGSTNAAQRQLRCSKAK